MARQPPKSMWSIFGEYFVGGRLNKPLDPEDEEPVRGKVVVITGANSGIGAEAALQFAKRGARVLMPCRDMEKGKAVVMEIKNKFPDAELTLLPLDLADLASVRACAAQIRAQVDHIDILINNAGTMYPDSTLTKTTDGFETHMGTNYLGPFLLTNLLLDLVTKAGGTGSGKSGTPSRIVFTASRAWQRAVLDLDDLMSEKAGAFGPCCEGPYANSKLANMYNAYSLAKRLREEGSNVRVYALCPGAVRSSLGRHAGDGGWLLRFGSWITQRMAQTTEEGVGTLLYCALSKKCGGESGLMYRRNGLWVGAMEEAVDGVVADKLWKMSEQLVVKGK